MGASHHMLLRYNAPVTSLRSIKAFVGCAILFAAPVYADRLQIQASLLSNYVWRGISESQGNPALQAAIRYQGPFGLYVRAFGSTVDYQGAYGRADFSGGIRNMTPSGLGFNVGETAYRFDESTLNFEESFLRLRFGEWSGAIYHDWQHGNTYLETGYTVGLGSGLHLLLHAGHTSGDTEASYNDYGIGIDEVWHRYTVGLFVTTTNTHFLNHFGGTQVAVALTHVW